MPLYRVICCCRAVAAGLIAFAAGLSAAACRSDAAPSGGAGAADLPPAEQRAAARLALTEVFRTGESVPLTVVRGVDVDSRGQVYVGDWGNPYVTVLSPDGQVVRRIGRRGEGPGEFGNVSGVQVLRGDSLQVYDVQLDRMTVFLPGSDSVAYTVNLAGRAGYAHHVERIPGTDWLLAVYRKPFSPSDNPRDDELRKDVVRLFTVSRRTLRDSLLVYPSPGSLVLRSGGAVSVTSDPFGRQAIVRVGPDGRVYHAWTDTLAVRVTALDGTPAGGFALRADAPKVTADDVERAVAAMGPRGARFRASLQEAAPPRGPTCCAWPPAACTRCRRTRWTCRGWWRTGWTAFADLPGPCTEPGGLPMHRSTRPAACTRPVPGSSPRLLAPESLRFAAMAAGHAHPVLLAGETGCGKTHLARVIHDSGPRASGPFVRVNCAAIPESLFERELFGHARGAFTGAHEAVAGFLEAADCGTLFLDEIGELPLSLQPKLLAVLEEAVFRRLGCTRETAVDVRVIVATHRDLAEMVRAGGFRQDLFFRCCAFQHRVPTLRERLDRLAELADELLARNALPGASAPAVTEATLRRLGAHDWPGNLRELENVLRYAVVLSGGAPVEPRHLPEPLCTCALPARAAVARAEPEATARYHAPEDAAAECELIREALRLEGGNRTRAARRLGMSRSALWMKLRIYAAWLEGQDTAEGEAEPVRTGTRRLALVSGGLTVAEPECRNTFGHRANTASVVPIRPGEVALARD